MVCCHWLWQWSSPQFQSILLLDGARLINQWRNPGDSKRLNQRGRREKVIVSGLTGSIELTSGALIIRHRTLMGLVGLGLQGERKIFLSEITSIQLKRAG